VEEQGYEEQGCNFVHICFILEKAKRNLNSWDEKRENLCVVGIEARNL
jgi:hypothetical protein